MRIDTVLVDHIYTYFVFFFPQHEVHKYTAIINNLLLLEEVQEQVAEDPTELKESIGEFLDDSILLARNNELRL